MKPRNREITTFNISMLDVISGAVGAFLILMIVLFPSYQKTAGETDQVVEQENEQLRAELEKLRATQNSNEAETEQAAQKLMEERRKLENEIAAVTKTQQRQQTESKTNNAPAKKTGGGLLTLFAKWRKPMNHQGPDEFQIFLVPENKMMGGPVERRHLCEALRHRSLTKDYAPKSGVVVYRVTKDTSYAILYCRWPGPQDVSIGRTKVSGHVFYSYNDSSKGKLLPEIELDTRGRRVPIGRLVGYVRLDGENVEVVGLDGKPAPTHQPARPRARSSLMRALEELRTPGPEEKRSKPQPEPAE